MEFFKWRNRKNSLKKRYMFTNTQIPTIEKSSREMKPYALESNDIFLNSGGATDEPIEAFKLMIPSFVTHKRSDFEFLTEIGGPNQSHDALVIFDVVIMDHGLKRLAETLTNLHLIVNREGFCYVKTQKGGEFVLYRLNDLFNWSAYGVKPTITTIWNRCDVLNGDVLISYEDRKKSFEQSQNDLKKKEEEISELKGQLSNFEKQLIGKQEELEVKSCELAEAKAEVAALHTELKLQISNSKDHEKQLKTKEEDLGKVSSELSDAKAELRLMKTEIESSKEKVAELEVNQSRTEVELKFTRSELDSLKSTVATFQMEMNQFCAEADLNSIKSELESSKAEMVVLQKKLNHCQGQLAVTAVADVNCLEGSGSTQVDSLDVQEHTKFNILQSPLSISHRCDIL